MRSLVKTKSSVGEEDLDSPVKKCIYGHLGILEDAGFYSAVENYSIKCWTFVSVLALSA